VGGTVIWAVVGLVALGVVAVIVAVLGLSGRVRPLRRAVRRLWWRREELDRLRERVETIQERVQVLAEDVADLAARRARMDANPKS
jgi:hypothetical protein